MPMKPMDYYFFSLWMFIMLMLISRVVYAYLSVNKPRKRRELKS